MPVTNGAGHSDYTPIKQDVFWKVSGQLLGASSYVCRRPWAWDTLHAYDLTAGPGCAPDGTPGSPLLLAKHGASLGVPFHLLACEKNADAAVELVPRLEPYDFAEVLLGDHRDTLPRWLADNTPPKPTFGICYFDPNGTESLPLDLYDHLNRARATRTIDLLINVTATARKRQHDFDSLRLELEAVPKDYKFIRKPETAWHWVYFVGTNWKDAKFKRMGFVPLDSQEGQDYLWTATHTRDEPNPYAE